MDDRRRASEAAAAGVRGAVGCIVVIALLAVGVAIPHAMLDGTERLPEAEQRAARAAIALAWSGCVDNPLQRLYTYRVTVRHIEPAAPRSTAAWSGYRILLADHTLFGLPMRTLTAHPSGGMACFYEPP